MSKKTTPRVCIIGWDGADWRILRPMMEAGRLPNLAAFLAQARHGTLMSTLPPVTAPAWTTFLTGVYPGRHGLFTWQGPLNENLERPFLNASHVRAPRLWDWLTRAGLRSLFLNVPMTYPPAAFDGVLVGGMLTPGTHVRFTHPEEVKARLLAAMPDYQVDVEMQHTEKDRVSPRGMRAHLEEVRRATEQRTRAWELLLSEYGPFDVAMIVYEGTDRVQHPLYGYAANEPPDAADAQWEERREWVWDYYTFLDQHLGRVLEDCEGAEAVIFLSDHGFTGLHWEFCANEWLATQGWLRFQEGANRLYRPLRPLARVLKRFLPARFVERGREALTGLRALDWEHTLAYSGGPTEDGIWINLKGREPRGTVAPEDYERVREEIIAALREVRRPDGKPLCRAVYRREEVYHGPWVNLAADIILDLEEGVRFTSLRNPAGPFRDVLPPGQGTHRREGVLAVRAPQVVAGEHPQPVQMADLAPTILALLDIPIPEGAFDGDVLPDVVAEHTREAPVEVQEVATAQGYSEEDSRLIEEHLRSLGYVD